MFSSVIKGAEIQDYPNYKYDVCLIDSGPTPKDSLEGTGLTEEEIYQEVLRMLAEERKNRKLWLLCVYLYENPEKELNKELIAFERIDIEKSKLSFLDFHKIASRAKEIVFEYEKNPPR